MKNSTRGTVVFVCVFLSGSIFERMMHHAAIWLDWIVLPMLLGIGAVNLTRLEECVHSTPQGRTE